MVTSACVGVHVWVCVGAAHLHAVEVLKCSGEAARVAGSRRKNWLVRVRARVRVRVRVRVRLGSG